MNEPYMRNPIWTTSNAYAADPQRQHTPGSISTRTTVSGGNIVRVAPIRSGTLNSNNNHNGVGDDGGGGMRKAIPFASNFIGVQSKFRRKYYQKTIWATLIILIIILIIIIIVLSVTKMTADKVCQSKECIRTAANLLYAMDLETDPCEDFYQFTCGRWADEHPRPDSVTSNDWFREQQDRIMRELRDFLKANISNAEPKAVGKVKRMYKACMNVKLLDDLGLEPLLTQLKRFQLPILPSGLNITLSNDALKKHGINANGLIGNSSVKYNWLHSIVHIKKYLAMDVIYGFDIFPDPLNRTVNRMAIGTPEADSALPFNNDEQHKLIRKLRRKLIVNRSGDETTDEHDLEAEESVKDTAAGLAAYVDYAKKIVASYVRYLDPTVSVEEAQTNAAKLTVHAVKVARKLYHLKDDAENATYSSDNNSIEDIVYITIENLQNETDKLIAPKKLPIWLEYMQLMVKDVNLTKQFVLADLEFITSRQDISYLQTVSEYMLKVPAKHLEFFIWLTAVEELVVHTTSKMRVIHAEYMHSFLGTEGSSPRSLYCAHGVNSLMGMAVSFALADDDFTHNKLPNVENMLYNIRHTFDSLVRGIAWMDAQTKEETLQKSAQMKSFIGFPAWITNATTLNEHYERVRINESRHLENMIGVLTWEMHLKMENFYVAEPFGWATAPSNVNAFHTFQANAITIPIAILEYPFYDLGLEALNYGAIGAVLGHELTHGFDDSGRMFDKNGNMVQWWSNETIKEYVNRTECFIEQYNQYYLADIDEYIDGELTLGENIADNGGMREAFHAYRLYVSEQGKERQRLPGLERYSHEQLFFIAFGNLWCETNTPAASQYALEDPHCPGKIRLRGVLTNSHEFSETFQCARGTRMNPTTEKCRIW